MLAEYPKIFLLDSCRDESMNAESGYRISYATTPGKSVHEDYTTYKIMMDCEDRLDYNECRWQ